MNKETLTVEKDECGRIIYTNASGEIHNPNGPAFIWANGCKAYWIKGQMHNPNGPAIVYPDGEKSYYINGKKLTEAEFKAWQTQETAPLHNKTATIDGVECTLTAK